MSPCIKWIGPAKRNMKIAVVKIKTPATTAWLTGVLRACMFTWAMRRRYRDLSCLRVLFLLQAALPAGDSVPRLAPRGAA
jgi:hypothetical protein